MLKPSKDSNGKPPVALKLARGVAVLALVALTLVLSLALPIKPPRLPGVAVEPAPTFEFQGRQVEACTERGVVYIGLPFRINLYDECEQDTGIEPVPLLVDIVILTGLYGSGLKLITRKVTRD